MPSLLVDRPDQLYVEITREVTDIWVMQPVQEVLVARQQAEMKISAALAELYFQTGFIFSVRNSELRKQEILDKESMRDSRLSFLVHLSADL